MRAIFKLLFTWACARGALFAHPHRSVIHGKPVSDPLVRKEVAASVDLVQTVCQHFEASVDCVQTGCLVYPAAAASEFANQTVCPPRYSKEDSGRSPIWHQDANGEQAEHWLPQRPHRNEAC